MTVITISDRKVTEYQESSKQMDLTNCSSKIPKAARVSYVLLSGLMGDSHRGRPTTHERKAYLQQASVKTPMIRPKVAFPP